jgi:DNA modification methylase
VKLEVIRGDVRETLAQVPDGSVQCCVTSPPYWGLRSYLPKGHDDKHLEIGSESTPDEYVQTLVEVFRGVRRCLHESGTLWLNLGDSYASAWPTGNHRDNGRNIIGNTARAGNRAVRPARMGGHLKEKDLCMIPWRVALALQADGWWLRSVIVWHKKSCMPESVTDRPTNSWEPIFLLAKSQSYFYDAEAVKEASVDPEGSAERYKAAFGGAKSQELKDSGQVQTRTIGMRDTFNGTRNQRNVWSLGPEPYSEAHFATFPTEIPRRAILAGTSARGCCPKCYAPWKRVVERNPMEIRRSKRGEAIFGNRHSTAASGTMVKPAESYTTGWQPTCKCNQEPIPCTVLDPFAGSGTTGKVAIELGRRAILCELNEQYVALIEGRTRTNMGLPLF